jgi:peptidoglycan/xylan/chitin deacetylase (PgdA/CDA1 family)
MNAPFPILLYHRIDDAGLSTSTPAHVFREHLALLKRNGWRTLGSDEFSYYLEAGTPFPRNSFLITFDDGYASVHDNALEILRAFDFKAIAFLSTHYMRNPRSGIAGNDPDGDSGKFLSWEQVRALQASGVVDCQSHSHTHSNFTGWQERQIRGDLQTSIDMLVGELRLPRRHFRHLAWPWGLSTKAWRAIASAVGLRYQHGVSRLSFRFNMDQLDIPRTCFDATSLPAFQRQFWLQTGSCAPLWDIAYPMGRKLRGFSRLLKAA